MGSRSLFAALLLAGATVAQAAIDPSLFQELRWRSIGPYRAGRVLTVAGIPGDARHFWFGAVNGGVWKTDDAGRTWQPVFDSQPIGSIGAIALAPSDPNVIYVGTGEADMRSDIAQGDGVYKSTDGGKTWSNVGLHDTQQIGRILVDPRNANVVFVAALGHPYGPNAERGVFRSRDGGGTWQKVLFKNADTGAIDLAFEPGNPDVIYATLWQTRRPPWNVYPPSSGPGSGLYKSSDGGNSWKQIVGHGFPAAVGHVGLALSAAAPQRVYAMVDGEGGGLYRSDDGGANWKHTSADPRIWQRGWYFGQITADPKNADRIYAMNTIVLRSDDGGTTFVPLKGDDTGDDFHMLWIDPENTDRRILASDQGAQVTLNAGRTWSTWRNQPTAQIYRVSTDKRFPYWVYGAQQDSGAVALPSRGSGAARDGISMMQFREITAGGESDNIAPDPKDPDVIFGGRVDRLNLRTQQLRHVDPTLSKPDLYRSSWTLPLVFSQNDSRVLYFANQKLFRTMNGGELWKAISPDLTRENPAVPKTLDAPTAADNLGNGPRRGIVYTISTSRVARHGIWVGTDDGLIWHTKDEGAHWDNVTPKDLTAWSKVATVEASPFLADTAYAAVDRHRLDDFHPYIYRTVDGGKSWQLITKGIDADSTVNVVRSDPVRYGLLYAGTEKGVWVSFDNGDDWQPLQSGLPVTSVRDIEVHDADVVIATHGRGFYILDDVLPLRQVNSQVAAAPYWLYLPAVAFRVHRPGFTGTPLPKDEPVAPNPPDGAYIDYVLNVAPTEPITLDFYDAGGTLVRHYTSATPPVAPDLSKINHAPEWTKMPVALSTERGMHRFVWPLRRAAPAALATDDQSGLNGQFADGIWVPPGRYRVVLTVNGAQLAQPSIVAADPRVKLPKGAYAHQYELAQRIEKVRIGVAAASQAAAKLQKGLRERRKEAGRGLTRAIDEASGQLHAIAGTRASANPHDVYGYPPHSVDTLRYVGDALAKLQSAVDDVDHAPSPDNYAALSKLEPIAKKALARWSEWRTRKLPDLNRKLARARREPLVVPAP